MGLGLGKGVVGADLQAFVLGFSVPWFVTIYIHYFDKIKQRQGMLLFVMCCDKRICMNYHNSFLADCGQSIFDCSLNMKVQSL